jgi:choline dehydrogenase-like flavoprotein
LSAFIDARTVPSGTVLQPDLAIIGGGPVGISLALALANSPIRMVLLESGGMSFDAKTQALYQGARVGAPYLPLSASRLRFLGGSTNHWGGWCRPLDAIDFEQRPWLPYSGWPFARKEIARFFPHAQSLCEAGPVIYDRAGDYADGAPLALGDGSVATRWFQFSKTRDDVLPTHFGERYADDLKRIKRLSVYLHANVTGLRLAHDAGRLDHIDVATFNGRHFTVRPKVTVVAVGAIEVARLLLASNDVMNAGIGNAHDMVGRFFADHPIPRDTATLVTFAGNVAPYYTDVQTVHGAVMRAGFLPSEQARRDKAMLDSSTTIENKVVLDDLGRAALAATAAALGVDASGAQAYSLGCGMELAPDPERRLTLDSDKDAFGMPRLKLHMRIADSDFAHFRDTLKELARQLLAAKTGMLHLNLKTREEWLAGIDWGNHHMGTARMHVDPKQGVVDANSQVHGIPNLYVAGSAVFPTYGAANPTMNLLALTLRLAEHLRATLR